MKNSNLPPGVTTNMLPGNRPEDEAWEVLTEKILSDMEEHRFDEEEALVVWLAGLEQRGHK